jgi:hypothetical protein
VVGVISSWIDSLGDEPKCMHISTYILLSALFISSWNLLLQPSFLD